ncbi:MAG: ribosomal-processing cysteine protease Prp [Solobacterium sp.]|nr:ribosomal-processing cysteine protease Prp [Solobacterium sp.]
MIIVRIQEENSRIREVIVTGHAEADEFGKDLVCAAVSAITIGLCNALDEMTDSVGFEMEDNRIRIYVPVMDETAETVLRAGVIQLKTVAEVYSEFVQIINGGKMQ